MKDHAKIKDKVAYLPIKKMRGNETTEIVKEMIVFSVLLLLVLAIAMVFGA